MYWDGTYHVCIDHVYDLYLDHVQTCSVSGCGLTTEFDVTPYQPHLCGHVLDSGLNTYVFVSWTN